MLILISSIATIIMIFWFILLIRANNNDRVQAHEAEMLEKRLAAAKLTAEINELQKKAAAYEGFTAYIFGRIILRPKQRKIGKLNTQIENCPHGIPGLSETLILPGYVLQREAEPIGKSSFRKLIYTKAFELYGKKNAVYKTDRIMAKMLSYPLIGVSATLLLSNVLLGAVNTTAGIGVTLTGTTLILVLVYGIYDDLCDMVTKRHRSISRQFPNVISKLALLVTSGMIMDRAWKETAYSYDSEIYLEMRKTSEELDNLVSPEAAYAGFINRCNTKETAKLASAILQNLAKGNAEIGRLLKEMAREVWQERRHAAKRDAEKANSKLMIPTMLLFLAILVMLMVPIAMNFSGI